MEAINFALYDVNAPEFPEVQLPDNCIELKEAENGGYSTIVVGRRGLSKVEAFFMGRVGHEVVYGGKEFSVWVV